MFDLDRAIDQGKYVAMGTSPQEQIQQHFTLSEKTRGELFTARSDAHAKGWSDNSGFIQSADDWKEVPHPLRLAAVGCLLADVANGRDLRRVKYPIPSLRAALTIDTSEMVELF